VGNKLERNKGFTLVELIIAIAMLAFLMTAVSAFMVSGIASYKSAKADIRVHNSAQENYDKISDAIMEAKDIYLFGYLENDTRLYCFVRDEEQAKNISDVQEMIGNAFFFKDDSGSVATAYARYFDYDNYKTLNGAEYTVDGTKIYVKALVVDTSVALTSDDYNSLSKDADGKVTNSLTKTKVAITQEEREDTHALVTDDDGNPVYTEKDTLRQMFVFDEGNMYYMTKYAYTSSKNDNIVDALKGYTDSTLRKPELEDYIYSISFEVVENASQNRTNAVAYVDATNSALSVDLFYSDKNMTYTTQGMIKARNSYVLVAKK
jgi:prepilin-type N-terminal cleavage/methylation domain-containing protein